MTPGQMYMRMHMSAYSLCCKRRQKRPDDIRPDGERTCCCCCRERDTELKNPGFMPESEEKGGLRYVVNQMTCDQVIQMVPFFKVKEAYATDGTPRKHKITWQIRPQGFNLSLDPALTTAAAKRRPRKGGSHTAANLTVSCVLTA